MGSRKEARAKLNMPLTWLKKVVEAKLDEMLAEKKRHGGGAEKSYGRRGWRHLVKMHRTGKGMIRSLCLALAEGL